MSANYFIAAGVWTLVSQNADSPFLSGLFAIILIDQSQEKSNVCCINNLGW